MDFYLVEAPVFYPKQCVCGSQFGPMVDTGIERVLGPPVAGFEGLPASPVVRVYLCEPCVRTAGHLLGMVEWSAYQEAVEDLAAAQSAVDLLEAELAEARPVLDAVQRAANTGSTVGLTTHPTGLPVRGEPAQPPSKGKAGTKKETVKP